MLSGDAPLPAVNDPEGDSVPAGLRVLDAHVHLFPERVFAAIWRWFAAHAWPVRYRLDAEGVIAFLRARGLEGMVGLCYSHAPGMAEGLNAFMAEVAARHPDFVIPFGTVLPGEPGAREVVRRALTVHRLRGLKIHCHVQGVGPGDERLEPVYDEAERFGVPLIMHAGPEPASPAYPCDPREICRAEGVAQALRRHPDLVLVVPHLGADRYGEYADLLAAHPNLYLDTAMAVTDYLEPAPPLDLVRRWPRRILYGTDFPNVPYAWDRELRVLAGAGLPPADLAALAGGTARRLFGPPGLRG